MGLSVGWHVADELGLCLCDRRGHTINRHICFCHVGLSRSFPGLDWADESQENQLTTWYHPIGSFCGRARKTPTEE